VSVTYYFHDFQYSRNCLEIIRTERDSGSSWWWCWLWFIRYSHWFSLGHCCIIWLGLYH